MDKGDNFGGFDCKNFGGTSRASLITENSCSSPEIKDDITGPDDLKNCITVRRHCYGIRNTPPMVF